MFASALFKNFSGISEHHTTINNCGFYNGAFALYLYGAGSWANSEYGNSITNCSFINQYYRAIYLYYQRNLLFHNNYITSTYNYQYGFYASMFYYSVGSRITNNRYLNFAGNQIYGMHLYSLYGSTSDTSIIANNTLSIPGINEVHGIYCYNNQYTMLVHNSVLMTNSYSNSKAFYDNGSNQSSHSLNNIFQNIGGGYSIYYSTTYYPFSSNFNNIYGTGVNLGYYSGTNVIDFPTWQTTANRDSNSYSMDSQFADTNDLHTTAIILNGNGTPIPQVMYDMDMEPRNPTMPDIGADEFSPAMDDAGIVAVNYPKPPFPSGYQNIYVTLLNNGIDTLKSVNLSWSVNGAFQTTYGWTGTLLPGHTLDSMLMGTYNFILYNPHEIKVWTSLPNGNSDPEPTNDTATVSNLYPALQGMYTIGGTSPDFQSFTEAVTALNLGGVAGWVHFKVRDGVYNEQIKINDVLFKTLPSDYSYDFNINTLDGLIIIKLLNES